MTSEGNVPASQIPVLTGLRFVAALMVMFGYSLRLHPAFSIHAFLPPFGYVNTGMSLFLTLGGFVFTHSYGSPWIA